MEATNPAPNFGGLTHKAKRTKRGPRRCSACGSQAHDLRTCSKRPKPAALERRANGAAIRASANGSALAALLTRHERAELAAVVSVCDALRPLPEQRRDAVFRAALALLLLSPSAG